MSESISRQDAIDAARKCRVIEVTPAYMLIDKVEMMTELMYLPSAQLERKRAKWILQYNKHFGETSACFYYFPRCSNCGGSSINETNFCPNCGADMREGGE